MSDLSIIIATKNEQEYVANTLKNLLLATEEAGKRDISSEIIVVDSSSDNTQNIARKFVKKVYAFPSEGVSRARNYGARLAKGQILVFMDADTIVQKNTVIDVFDSFRKESTVCTIAYVMPLDYVTKPFSVKLFYAFDKLFIKSCDVFGFLIRFYNRGDIVATKKSVFNAVDGFDEKLYMLEITDFLVKASHFGRVRVLPRAVFETSRRLRKWGVLRSYRVWWRNYLTFYAQKRLHDTSYEAVR